MNEAALHFRAELKAMVVSRFQSAGAASAAANAFRVPLALGSSASAPSAAHTCSEVHGSGPTGSQSS